MVFGVSVCRLISTLNDLCEGKRESVYVCLLDEKLKLLPC